MGANAIWGAITIVVAVLLLLSMLIGAGLSTDVFVSVAMALVPLILTNMFLVHRVGKMHQDVKDVKEQTNGHMTNLIEKIPQADREGLDETRDKPSR